jgi:hypothetical protein
MGKFLFPDELLDKSPAKKTDQHSRSVCKVDP